MADMLHDRLLTLLHDSGLSEIEFEEGDIHIHLTRNGDNTAAAKIAVSTRPPDPPSPSEDQTIAAGLTGTFYRASAPDMPPFINVGDIITEGQIIGLLEAMKVLNPIEAPRAGRIGAILAENGALVTRGAPLILIVEPEALP